MEKWNEKWIREIFLQFLESLLSRAMGK